MSPTSLDTRLYLTRLRRSVTATRWFWTPMAAAISLSARTVEGRSLTAVLEPDKDPGSYYPITARPASKKEQRLWAEHKESKP